MLWLTAGAALLGLAAALCALVYFAPLSLRSNLQARAEPSGAWALAGGLGLGPLALSVIAAAGVAPFVSCHLFGRQVLRVPLTRFTSWRRRTPKPASTASSRASRAERFLTRFFKGLDPVDTVLAWWDTERVFEVRSLIVDLDYSFGDVAFTGRVLAALCVLSAVLPGHWQLNQTPSWDSEDRVLLAADARFRVWLGRLLFDVTLFVLKERSRMRQKAVPANE